MALWAAMADHVSSEVGPADSASQVGDGSNKLVPVGSSAVSGGDKYRERKRLFALMDRQSKSLPPQALAVYMSCKGNHKKRDKLVELFLTYGNDIGATMSIFSTTERIDKKDEVEQYVPMSYKQLIEKFGEDAATQIATALEQQGKFDRMPMCPDNKDTWLYHVYGGRSFAAGSSVQTTVGTTVKCHVANQPENVELVGVLNKEMVKGPRLEDPESDQSDAPKKSKRPRGKSDKDPTPKAKQEPRRKRPDHTPGYLKEAAKLSALAAKDLGRFCQPTQWTPSVLFMAQCSCGSVVFARVVFASKLRHACQEIKAWGAIVAGLRGEEDCKELIDKVGLAQASLENLLAKVSEAVDSESPEEEVLQATESMKHFLSGSTNPHKRTINMAKGAFRDLQKERR